jgi:hypothetical protein
LSAQIYSKKRHLSETDKWLFYAGLAGADRSLDEFCHAALKEDQR